MCDGVEQAFRRYWPEVQEDLSLADFLREGLDEMAKNPKPPCMSLFIDEPASAVELCLDSSRPTHSEWIEGEGSDICLHRDLETGRVVGCRLPLYQDRFVMNRAANPEVNMSQEIEAKLAAAVSSEFRSPFAKADSLLAVVFEVLKDGVDKDDLCDAVDHVWATVVEPYDIPYVPEFIEKRLERRALLGIHEAIHTWQ